MVRSFIKKMWIKALRSGEYVQCHGLIEDGTGKHCALGVLGALHQRAEGYKSMDEWAYIAKWSRITSEDANKCIQWNDVDKLSFTQIADLIEKT